jgi:hypothetical protein
VKQLGGVPFKLRTDCGTENVLMATLQCHLRQSVNAHMYGTSQNNQRIESWWCYMRKMRTQWWIEYFNDLELSGDLDVDNCNEIDCLRFCFMKLLQRDLSEVQTLWNNHRIRKSKGATCPGGVPDHLFFTPGRRALQCLVSVSHEQCTQLMSDCSVPSRCQNKDLENRFNNMGVSEPTSAADALTLFMQLKQLVV